MNVQKGINLFSVVKRSVFYYDFLMTGFLGKDCNGKRGIVFSIDLRRLLIEDENDIFLKTIIPSRKATKLYLNK